MTDAQPGDNLVLVVEDDTINRTALERLLRFERFAVESAGTVAEAVGKVERLRPRFLLLDAALPDGQGIELLHYLNARHMTPAVAVLTGSVDPAAFRDYENAGAQVILSKPFPPGHVLRWLKSHDAPGANDPAP